MKGDEWMSIFEAIKSAFPWSSGLVVAVCAILVRFLVRPFLAARWNYFKRMQAAPYFLLFIAMLLVCAVLLCLDQQALASNAAMAAYCVMVMAIIVGAVQLRAKK
jgi:hypothetical protein